MLKNIYYKIFKPILNYFGLILLKINSDVSARKKGLHANVGCGSYEIDGFISVDYYSKSYYTNKKFERVHYDMRNDTLPFEDNSLDTIYCSHVIEHVETEHVKKFFSESLRVLKPGGVLRIVCPDTEYLYEQLINHPEYFSWHPLYKSSISGSATNCFIDEVATPKIKLENFGLSMDISKYNYDELVEELRKDLIFDENRIGQHINNWDFKRIFETGIKVGFFSINKSRYQGSFCSVFRGRDIDLTHPEMSLYIDLQKKV